MQRKTHEADGVRSEALYSDCGQYRYRLTRVWDSAAPRVLFVMLNPSTASETRNDPTIARCQKRAELLGFGTVDIANLFAFRATDPADLRTASHPIGPDNDAVLLSACNEADVILAAWGVHGTHMARDIEVVEKLHAAGHTLQALGETRHGLPRHPLYVSYAQRPQPWPRTANSPS